MTDSNRLARLLEIVRAARELPPEERQAYVRKACAGDPVLLEDALYELESDTGEVAVPLPTAQLQPGDRVGEYVIQAFIGRGGFGEVYRAEQQGRIRRPRVALKLLRPERDHADVLARFRQEWLTLAVMEHPGIAKVLDVGATEDGRPFFVMEYVDGKTLMRYCDDERLSVEQRLELFRNICSAVEHAHQKGVIHRDLKPSNILVSTAQDTPEPKIIDFGVAKALDPGIAPRPRSTVAGQPIGTLPYMAPEQAGGLKDIDTRADLYSLGVVLYELLTGRTPFEPADFEVAGQLEMLRFIREEEPLKPSEKLNKLGPDASQTTENRSTDLRTLMRKLREDLDWVAVRCLEKDRERRYSSAGELASEIDRYLRGQALLAGPPSRSYRFGKFVRRNRGPIAAGVAIAIALLAGTAGTTYYGVEAARERELVEGFQAEALLESAKRVSRLEPAEASRLIDQVLLLDPNLDAAVVLRARLDRREGDAAGARQTLEEFLARRESPLAAATLGAWFEIEDPELARTYLDQARPALAEAAMLAIRAEAQTDWECADALYTRSLELDRWNFDNYWDRAINLYEAGRHREAAEEFAYLTGVRQEQFEVWLLKGVVETEIEDLQTTAEESLDQAIVLDPENWLGFYNRARARGRLGREPEALEDLERARELAPEEAHIFDALGRSYDRLRRWEESSEVCDRYFELGGESREPLRRKARASRGLKNYAEAVKYYRLWIEAHPNPDAAEVFAARSDLGYSLLILGNADEATAEIEGVYDRYPTYDYNSLRLVKLRWHQSRFDDAVVLMQGIEERRKKSIDSLQLGVAHWFAGDLQAALAGMGRYVDAGKEDGPWIRLWMAGLQRRSHLEQDARDNIQTVAQQDLGLVSLVAEHLLTGSALDCSADSGLPDKDRLYCLTALGIHADGDEREGFFEEVVGLDFKTYLEHEVARWSLLEGADD